MAVDKGGDKEQAPVGEYTIIKTLLGRLTNEITQHKFFDAELTARALAGNLSAFLAPKGLDDGRFDKDFESLYYRLRKGVAPQFTDAKVRECKKKLREIVMKMADVGLYFGQVIETDARDVPQLKTRIKNLLKSIDSNCDGLISKGTEDWGERVRGDLWALEDYVNAVPVEHDGSKVLKKEVISSIGEVKSRLSTILKVGKQTASATSIMGFTKSKSQMTTIIEEFLSTLDDEGQAGVYAAKYAISKKEKGELSAEELTTILSLPEIQEAIGDVVEKKLDARGVKSP